MLRGSRACPPTARAGVGWGARQSHRAGVGRGGLSLERVKKEASKEEGGAGGSCRKKVETAMRTVGLGFQHDYGVA